MNKSEFIMYVINKFEGGSKVHCVSGDSGGVTKYGIAQNYNPSVDVPNLTIEEAIQIYENKYWVIGKCDMLFFPLNQLHFDATINCGRGGANSILQMALKEYGEEVKHDAWFGKKTYEAVKMIRERLRFCMYYQKSRHQYYYNLAAHNKEKRKFFRGWTNRVWMLSDKVLFETAELWKDPTLSGIKEPEELPEWAGYM